MKLLLDQNLSHRLVEPLAKAFGGALHVRELGLERASDEGVWQAGRDQGCVIVSKDRDFLDLSMLRGHPPEVVWIRAGNADSSTLLQLPLRCRQEIESFADLEESSLLVVP